ncbi:kinesin-like protein KIN-7M, chloroplastic isoform X5 [Silene latifolia]|uniref:kinesin-like protein KIN-7M, chloroplastic isoform X5 n=1 Tax=Silene latifolia TaxID=37657 RepID=UPI003D77546C
MDGINGTVFAYGVTSSGKTHTMHGDDSYPGIIPLAIKDVFSIIQETSGREFLLRVSYLEIYNEVINDLLDPTGQNLRIREDVQGTYVEGIKEEVVLSPGHALSFIAAGEEHRHVGSNNFNLFSSRSHTIFTLMIESSAPGDDYDGVIFSQLARDLLKALLVIGASVGLFLGIVATSIPWLVPNVFTPDLVVIAEMHKVWIPFFLSLCITPCILSCEGTLLAGRDLKFISLSMSGCFTLGALVLLFVKSQGMGLVGCWTALVGFQWARFFLSLRRILSPDGVLFSEDLSRFKLAEVKAA